MFFLQFQITINVLLSSLRFIRIHTRCTVIGNILLFQRGIDCDASGDCAGGDCAGRDFAGGDCAGSDFAGGDCACVDFAGGDCAGNVFFFLLAVIVRR